MKLTTTNLPFAGVAAASASQLTSGGAGGRVYRNRTMTKKSTPRPSTSSPHDIVLSESHYAALVAVAEAAYEHRAGLLNHGTSQDCDEEALSKALDNYAAVRGGKVVAA